MFFLQRKMNFYFEKKDNIYFTFQCTILQIPHNLLYNFNFHSSIRQDRQQHHPHWYQYKYSTPLQLPRAIRTIFIIPTNTHYSKFLISCFTIFTVVFARTVSHAINIVLTGTDVRCFLAWFDLCGKKQDTNILYKRSYRPSLLLLDFYQKCNFLDMALDQGPPIH